MDELNLTQGLKTDIEKAIYILKQNDCEEIYIFGSVAKGSFSDASDIDIAVRGLHNDKFFLTLGLLLTELSRDVDLVDLDEEDNAFVKHLLDKEELVRVA